MLNEKAMQVYEFIRARIDSGYAPTVREICTALNIKSTSTVHRYIKCLVDEGLLDKMDGSNRAIRLHGYSAQNIPLVGKVTAGVPLLAIENVIGYISFVPQKQHEGKLFALSMRGDSMINAGILDGDTVVLEQCSDAENGAIAAVLADEEELHIMRYYKEQNGCRLQPEHDTMQAVYPEIASVLGKVTALIRYMDQ